MHAHALRGPRKLHLRGLRQFAKHIGSLARGFDRHQTRMIAIVQIGCVVSDLIAGVDQLRLKRRTQPRQIFVQFLKLTALEIARVFGDPLANFKRQVQPRKARIATFKRFDDAQRL